MERGMAFRGKSKTADDFQYVTQVRRYENTPLRTTIDGLRNILVVHRFPSSYINDFLSEVDAGTTYIPGDTGVILSVHRKHPAIEDLLREIASTFKHSGLYGNLWWNRKTYIAWWVYAFVDTQIESYTSLDLIQKRLSSVKTVKRVRIELEARPDPTRDIFWIELWDGTHRC